MKKQILVYLSILAFVLAVIAPSNMFGQIKVSEGKAVLDINGPYKIAKVLPDDDRPAIQDNEDKKYVFFNNLDEAAFLFYGYYTHIFNSEYKDHFLEASFSDNFFAEHDITDFDLAVFIVGSIGNSIYPLNVTTSGGHSVFGKIKEMLDAGKKVFLASRYGLEILSQNPDPEMNEFFENTLGVEYLGMQNMISDNTYVGYVAKGAIRESVSMGSIKYCNLTYNGESPPALYSALQIMKLKDGAKAEPVDHFVYDRDDARAAELLGLKYQNDEAKLCFWCYGFENMANNSSREFITMGGIRWLLKEAPAPGPNIELIPDVLSFGSVEIGETVTGDFVVSNTGVENLVITEAQWAEFSDPGIFTIEGGLPNFPLTIEPDDYITMTVTFEPQTQENYSEFLDFYSNAANGSVKGIQFKGIGGQGVGPRITADPEVQDFGYVKQLKQEFADIFISNSGNRELIINIIAIENDERNAYDFIFGNTTPVTLDPGQEHNIRIRFVPQEEGEIYSSRLKILNNSINEPQLYVPLNGREGEASNPVITLNLESIDFGDIDPSSSDTKDLLISNSGEANLEITGIDLEDNDDGAFKRADMVTLPVTIEPDGEVTLMINFDPTEEKDYSANLKITSNAANEPEVTVPLTGRGFVSSVLDGKANSQDGLLTLAIAPNPVSSSAFLYYTVNGDLERNINLFLLDVTGKKLATIVNQAHEPGDYQIIINSIELSSGTYYINGDINGSPIQLPIIVTK